MQSEVSQSAGIYDAWAWFEKNRQSLLIGLLVAAVVGVVALYMVLHHGEKQIAAGQELTKVWLQTGAGERPGSAQEFLKVAAAQSGSDASAQAVLLAAGALFDEGKYDQSRAQFNRFIREFSGSPLLSQAYLGVAATLDAEKKSPEAIAAYKDVIEHHPSDAVLPLAKFALAGIYVSQEKLSDARMNYEDVARNFRNTLLGQESAERLAELDAKHPELAPKPLPAPVPPSFALPKK
jgi:predicted negative regulator of RcsB-dependent stress response